MIINENAYKLFCSDSVDKQLKLKFQDGTIVTNKDIFSESMNISEAICSEQELRFGGCIASSFSIKIANIFNSHINQKLEVTMTLNGTEEFKIGTYKVQSDKPTADRVYREITAYDAMYDVVNANVIDWYNEILPNIETSTITLKEMRESLLNHLGVPFVNQTLINDDIVTKRTVSGEVLSGKDVLRSICELSGGFGKIRRDGKFECISLDPLLKTLYPRDDLYPENTVFPAMPQSGEEIAQTEYISCKYEDFSTNRVTRIVIRGTEDDVGCIVGSAGNSYIITNNILVSGKTDAQLRTVANRLLSKISDISYIPSEVAARANLCLETGDSIFLSSKYKVITTYIFDRKIKGIQALRDSYSANGVETYSEQINGTNYQLQKLYQRTHEIVNTVDEMTSKITNIEASQGVLTESVSEISQKADSIELSVNQTNTNLNNLSNNTVHNGQISSKLSVETGGINISGNRITIDSTNFKVSQDGSVTASNANLSGRISATSGSIAGWQINTNSLNASNGSSISPNGIYLPGISISNNNLTLSSGGNTASISSGVYGYHPDYASGYGITINGHQNVTGNLKVNGDIWCNGNIWADGHVLGYKNDFGDYCNLNIGSTRSSTSDLYGMAVSGGRVHIYLNHSEVNSWAY